MDAADAEALAKLLLHYEALHTMPARELRDLLWEFPDMPTAPALAPRDSWHPEVWAGTAIALLRAKALSVCAHAGRRTPTTDVDTTATPSLHPAHLT